MNTITGATTSESVDDFKTRIRSIKYTCTPNNIVSNITRLGLSSNIRVIPDFTAFPTGDQRDTELDLSAHGIAGNFGNFGVLDLKLRYKCFSVVLIAPVIDPISFADADSYLDTNTWLGTEARVLDTLTINSIQALIKEKSPLGSAWRLLIKDFTPPTAVGNLASQQASLNS